MARQYKKILRKLKPKSKKSSDSQKPEKIGKDYILIAILTLTVLFMVIGWTNFDWVNRALYVALVFALSTTYARRHFDISENADVWVERLSYMSMGSAIVLFAIEIYYRFVS